MTRISWIEFSEGTCWDTLEHLLGENTQQLPANVERFEDRSILVASLRNKVLLELGEELEIEKIVRCKSLLSYDGLHGQDVLTDGIASVLKFKQIH